MGGNVVAGDVCTTFRNGKRYTRGRETDRAVEDKAVEDQEGDEGCERRGTRKVDFEEGFEG